MRIRSSLFICLLAFTGCLKVEAVAVDRQMQLENQVLGQLKRLESNIILVSSVRGSEARARPPSPLAQEAADAARRRAFNADDIDGFKRAGQLGEANNAELMLLASPKARQEARWLRELVAQENHDRVVLIRRALQLSPELSTRDLSLGRRAFHRLVLRAARPGDRIQREDGTWTTVPKPEQPGQR